MTNQTVGELAVSIPGATEVFRRYKVDFCCGGNKPLTDAAPLTHALIFEELETLVLNKQQDPSEEQQNTPELIESILNRFHKKHRVDLPELIELAKKVERVHDEHPACPNGLFDRLTLIEQELEQHMLKEEQILFPAMLNEATPEQLVGPLACMDHEHNEMGEHLRFLSRVTHDFTPPEEACNTWCALYLGLSQFGIDITNHIHLENNVLFKRFQ